MTTVRRNASRTNTGRPSVMCGARDGTNCSDVAVAVFGFLSLLPFNARFVQNSCTLLSEFFVIKLFSPRNPLFVFFRYNRHSHLQGRTQEVVLQNAKPFVRSGGVIGGPGWDMARPTNLRPVYWPALIYCYL